jgi:hypothetical protein
MAARPSPRIPAQSIAMNSKRILASGLIGGWAITSALRFNRALNEHC